MIEFPSVSKEQLVSIHTRTLRAVKQVNQEGKTKSPSFVNVNAALLPDGGVLITHVVNHHQSIEALRFAQLARRIAFWRVFESMWGPFIVQGEMRHYACHILSPREAKEAISPQALQEIRNTQLGITGSGIHLKFDEKARRFIHWSETRRE